jgi:RNA polymerase sigma factor (sigma-70 family)
VLFDRESFLISSRLFRGSTARMGNLVQDSRGPDSPEGHAAMVAEWLESPYLRRVACRVAALHRLPSSDVLDLVQELSLALLKAAPGTLVNPAWLFRTASHKAIDLFRSRIRAAKVALDSRNEPDASSNSDPDLLRLLRVRAARLPAGLARFYRLRIQEGLSQREISERLGLCRGSVRLMERRFVRMMKGRMPGKDEIRRCDVGVRPDRTV